MVTRHQTDESRSINVDRGFKMTYKYFGQTGMKVSKLSYGTWINKTLTDEEGQKLVSECVKACYDRGINFFDTAEEYLHGRSEVFLGNALKQLSVPRKDYVVSTKIFWGNFGRNHLDSINDLGLSRKHIIEGLRTCLKRLQLDYVDVVFAHRADYNTPVEETVRAFSWCIDQGLAHYWATSEWPAARIEEACMIASKYRLHAPQAEQCQYNMLDAKVRSRFEAEYRTLFESRGYGTTVYSPLCFGFLTGKYNEGTLPKDSRGAIWVAEKKWECEESVEQFFGPEVVEKTKSTLQGLAKIAADFGCTQAQLALAWVLVHQDVSTAILGISRLEQLDENLKALEVSQRWTPEVEKQISDLLGNAPEPEMNFRTWTPKASRRPKQE